MYYHRIYYHYVKEHDRLIPVTEDCQGVDPYSGPSPIEGNHRTSLNHYVKKPSFQKPANPTGQPACGATGIRTLDPCLAKAVL